MASRSHVDSKANAEVAERRLRPIYDCLDNGNNKKALQEADKVLKKQKDFLCAKVLKSLSLLRLGRHDESTGLLHEVHQQHPTDEATLQAMAICYREIHKLDLIADMYENANKSKPGNEETLTALFMAYVRLGDYKKQQQTAMALHKLKPQKNPYYFWAVMSIVMQAHSSPHDLAQKMFLPLAERMTKKFVEDDKIEAEAEVQMYLIILELLGRWQEAVNVLNSPIADRLVSELNVKEIKEAELYTHMEDWTRTNQAYRKLISKDVDNVGWWKEYICSMVQLSATNTETSGNDVDNTAEKALEFIVECREVPRSRGPYLAHLELILQCQQHSDKPCRQYGDPVELLNSYYDMFGDKYCCFSDVRAYLEILMPQEQTKLIEILQRKNQYTNTDGSLVYVENVKQMQRHITSLQLCRCLGCHENLTKEGKLSFAHELVQRHNHGIQFGEDLLTTDLQYCDNYLLLAVALMIEVWQTDGEQGIVWQMIVLLELGLKASPSSSQMKLVLIRLYCSMGAFGPCPALYDGMEIKHIMNDTLGYIVSSHVGRLGHFMAACAMYGTMLRFFTVNHKETAEYLIASYKYGSFTKINEFVRFRDRLQNSLQYASATAERMLLDMILDTNSHVSTEQMVNYMEIDPAKDKTDPDQVQDNRDLTVILCWDPPSTYSINQAKQQSLKEELAWLKVRNLTLRILAGSVMLGQKLDHDHTANNGVTDDGKPALHSTLADLRTQFAAHIEICQQCYTQEIKYPVQGPFRTRLVTYLQGNYHTVFLEMLDNLLYIHSLQDIQLDKTDSKKEERLQTSVPKLVEGVLDGCPCKLLIEDGAGRRLDPCILETTVLAAEVISHVCVMTGVCYRMLKPVKTVLTRRNKKKKDNPLPMPCTFENYNELVAGLEVVCGRLHKTASDLDPIFLGLDFGQLNLTKQTDTTNNHVKGYAEMEREVWKKVELAYQQSVVEITELLHKKLQYLGGIHL
ncbi:N-alpha-acetyltransferase 25, NatB auxiliary subunit-like [Mya arenaria]|uniref:N-alpha-acetyltransferase 25, NatB auxiliary subunit-like n=1 Tax=Mya arenaria TaxID=6604 RepID=UPI0022DFCCC4|nr:N-alpha-acetyltransferase 25, NatB auxiliary subunit-like [Mya arenaria]